jgi:anti-sigma28 factor (negative regulator of flagellin synthesis)
MNEYHLDSTSGENLTPRRLEQEAPSNKKPGSPPAQNVSFQKVLKSAVDKVAGSPEIRKDLVNKYKVSLANGTYEVKAQELAEKMIQKIRESKTRGII